MNPLKSILPNLKNPKNPNSKMLKILKMNILDKIVLSKRAEIEQSKKLISSNDMIKSPYFKEAGYSLKRHLKNNSVGIISEFKRKSPSLGWIKEGANVVDITSGYAAAGAAALSVLTDEPFFGGTLSDLRKVRQAVSIPILRKDFIIDEYQLFEAKSSGADVILLIAECLDKKSLKSLAETAKNLGLEVLMEVHSEEQLEKLCDAVDCVGVNNRNLKNFKVSLQTSIDLSAQIPSKFVKIAESGISNPANISLLSNYGFKGFLIGEAFMKTENPADTLKQFIQKASQPV
jgi:indole-3-glycerol phosphate synthase